MARKKKTREAEVPKAPVETVQGKEKIDPVSREDAYFVHKKHLNTKRGIMEPGARVYASDFAAGDAALADNVSVGSVIKMKVVKQDV